MPPKKSNNVGYSGDTLSRILQHHGVTSQESIHHDLLLKLYRLKDSNIESLTPYDDPDDPIEGSDDGRRGRISRFMPPIHQYTACQDPWSGQDDRETSPLMVVGAKRKVETSIEIVDDTDNDSDACRGKGKGRAKPATNGAGKTKKHVCSKEACKLNPRCLRYLGQDKWENVNEAYETFAKQWGLRDNPLHEMAEPDLPVGLRNLGATCYANSFLQVWFQDPIFRSGVFSCQLPSNKTTEEQPLFQLQVLFAALQLGRARAFNPVDLVKSLSLDTGEQQDAQEFGKLFMEMLDTQFKKQAPQSGLRDLVSKQFEGRIDYGTRCLHCHRSSLRSSTYRELEVNLKHNQDLEVLLMHSLAAERLTGDNRYRCEGCHGLRDAERFTEIKTLPHVLHFSLLRFKFDFENEERRKSNAAVAIPQSIDMGRFVGDRNDVGQEEAWYDLKGVLCHKGTSAYHGHYVAHINDARYDKWFVFDDETVYAEDIFPARIKKQSGRNGKHDSLVAAKEKVLEPRDFYGNPLQSRSLRTGEDIELGDELLPEKAQTATQRPRSTPKTVISLDQTDSDSEKENMVRVRSSSSTSTRTAGGSGSAYRTTQRTYKDRGKNIEGDQESSKRRKVMDEEDVIEEEESRIPRMKSKDAYMVIYAKREPKPSSMPMATQLIPAFAASKLDELEKIRTANIEAFIEEEQRCQTDFKRIRHNKRSVYTCWADHQDSDDGYLVSASALEKWLTNELTPPPKKKLSSVDEKVSNVASTSSVEAISGHIQKQVNVITNGETSTSRSQPATPASLPGDHGHAVEMMEVDEPQSSHTTNVSTPLDTQAIREHDQCSGLQAKPAQSGSDSVEEAQPIAERASLLDASDANSARRPAVLPVTCLDSSELLCVHDKLDLKQAGRVKRISQAGVQALQQLGLDIVPLLSIEDHLCRACVWQPQADRAYLDAHNRNVSRFNSYSNGQSRCRYISKAWLSDWLKAKPSMHAPGATEDPAPDSEDYYFDTFCQCGRGLQPDESLHKLINERQAGVLHELFPNRKPFLHTSDFCPDCLEDFDKARKDQSQNARLAKDEGSNKSLTGLKARGSLALEYMPTVPTETCFAVPRDWLDGWHLWQKKPLKNPRPSDIDLEKYFCEHGTLVVDLNFPGDRRNFAIVSGEEWQALSEIYGGVSSKAIMIKFRKVEGQTRLSQKTPVCNGCRNIWRSSFEKIVVRLFFLNDDDLEPSGMPKAYLYEEQEPIIIDLSEEPADVAKHGLRRSMRERKKPGSSLAETAARKRRPPKTLDLERTDTLKDIRVWIEEMVDIPILYQNIFYRDRQIEDAAETVETIGIHDQETLFVQELPAHDDDVDLSDLANIVPGDGAKAKKTRRSGRTEGFSGTGLYGSDTDATMAVMDQVANIAAALPGVCSKCTYQNHADMISCEMCTNPLPAIK